MAGNPLQETIEFWNQLIEYADVMQKQTTGAEDVTWTAPNGETGKSFLGYVKELFDTFGYLPRFKTVETLQKNDNDFADGVEGAVELKDGDYAFIGDDTNDKNGIYIKKSGVWVKSKYDVFGYINSKINSIYRNHVEDINWKNYEIKNKSCKNDGSVGDTALIEKSGLSIIKLNVSNYKTVTTSNVRTNTPWVWIFTDNNDRIVKKINDANTSMEVPKNAVHLVRNVSYEAQSMYENNNMSIQLSGDLTLERIGKDVDEHKTTLEYLEIDLDALKAEFIEHAYSNLNWTDNVEHGWAVDTSGDESIILVPKPDLDIAYTYIDVKNMRSFTVSNAISTFQGWKWVFADANGKRIGMTSGYGDGVYEVPPNAVKAYRGVRYVAASRGANYIENPDMTITGNIKVLSLQDRVDSVENSVEKFKSSLSKPDDLDILIENMQEQLETGSTLKLSTFEGATSDEKIRNALAYIKKRGNGILDLETGEHIVNSAVILPSNCWLYLNEATLRLADGVFDNIVRNDGIVVGDGDGDLATEINENVNIRVIGKGITSSTIKGNKNNPKVAPRPFSSSTTAIPWLGDYFGWRTLGIYFNNVKNFEIGNFHMTDTVCWAISVEHGCEDFEIHHIHFDTSVKNGDGIDVRMGTKNGHVHHITGRTGDDMVALTAIRNWQTTTPPSPRYYMMQVAGFDDIGRGVDIENIRVNDVTGGGPHNGMRLLATGGSRISNISIDNIADESASNHFNASLLLISNDTTWGESSGRDDDISEVYVNGVIANGSARAVYLKDNLANSHINYVRQLDSSKELIVNNATLTNVEITNAI